MFSRKTKTASQKSTKVFYSLKSLHPIILPVAIDLLAGLFFCFLASVFPQMSELIGYVDLTDFRKIWPRYSWNYNKEKDEKKFFKLEIFFASHGMLRVATFSATRLTNF